MFTRFTSVFLANKTAVVFCTLFVIIQKWSLNLLLHRWIIQTLRYLVSLSVVDLQLLSSFVLVFVPCSIMGNNFSSNKNILLRKLFSVSGSKEIQKEGLQSLMWSKNRANPWCVVIIPWHLFCLQCLYLKLIEVNCLIWMELLRSIRAALRWLESMRFGAHLTPKIVSVGSIAIDTQLFIMKTWGGPLDQSLGDIQGKNRVSQQVWDMLNVMLWSSEKFASEASYV